MHAGWEKYGRGGLISAKRYVEMARNTHGSYALTLNRRIVIGNLHDDVRWSYVTTTTRMLCQYSLSISTMMLAKHSGSCNHITPSNVIVQMAYFSPSPQSSTRIQGIPVHFFGIK